MQERTQRPVDHRVPRARALRRDATEAEKKLWQHLLVDLLGEGLPFLLAALSVTFQAMAKHFMKEDCRCPAGKQCRAVEGFRQGRRS